MNHISDKINLIDVPDYVRSWSAASIPDFVPTVLKRWEREFGSLPELFFIVMCPQVEINSHGGLPAGVYQYVDPKLSCRHFTGCHKPYFFAIFIGEKAKDHCLEVQKLLAWLEAYKVDLTKGEMELHFLASTEVLDEESDAQTRMNNLLTTAQLIRILE